MKLKRYIDPIRFELFKNHMINLRQLLFHSKIKVSDLHKMTNDFPYVEITIDFKEVNNEKF